MGILQRIIVGNYLNQTVEGVKAINDDLKKVIEKFEKLKEDNARKLRLIHYFLRCYDRGGGDFKKLTETIKEIKACIKKDKKIADKFEEYCQELLKVIVNFFEDMGFTWPNGVFSNPNLPPGKDMTYFNDRLRTLNSIRFLLIRDGELENIKKELNECILEQEQFFEGLNKDNVVLVREHINDLSGPIEEEAKLLEQDNPVFEKVTRLGEKIFSKNWAEETLNNQLSDLRRRGFDVDRYPKLARFVVKYGLSYFITTFEVNWDGKEIPITSEETLPNLILLFNAAGKDREHIYYLLRYSWNEKGLITPKYWDLATKAFCVLVNKTKTRQLNFFKKGLPELITAGIIRNEFDIKSFIPDIKRINKTKNPDSIFEFVFSVLAENGLLKKWDYLKGGLISIGNTKFPSDFFLYGFPTLVKQGLLKKWRQLWPDIVKMANTQHGDALFHYAFPILARVGLLNHWDRIKKDLIVLANTDFAEEIFKHVFLAFADSGKLTLEYWDWIVGFKDDLVKLAIPQSTLFSKGLPELVKGGMFRYRLYIEKMIKDLIELQNQPNRDSSRDNLFSELFPVLAYAGFFENYIYWEKIKDDLIKLMNTHFASDLMYSFLPTLFLCRVFRGEDKIKEWKKINKVLLRIAVPLDKTSYKDLVRTGNDGNVFLINSPGVIKDLIEGNILSFDQVVHIMDEISKEMVNRRGAVLKIIFEMYKTGVLTSSDNFRDIERALDNPKQKITNYTQLISFLHALLVNPKKMKKPLKNLIAILSTTTLSDSAVSIEGGFDDKIREAFSLLLNQKGLDLGTKNLLKRLASLLPLGGNAELVGIIRQDAIDLQNLTNQVLLPFRKKIHNWSGREDMIMVKGLIDFLNSGNIDKFKVAWKESVGPIENQVEGDMVFEDLVPYATSDKREEILKKAEELLEHEREFWESKSDNLRERYSGDEIDGGGLMRYFSDEIKESKHWKEFNINMEKIIKILDEEHKKPKKKRDYSRFAHLIGYARRDLHKVRSLSRGRLKDELYYFDLFLQNLEHQAYTPLLKGFKKLETMEEFNQSLQYLEQLLYSVVHSDLDNFKKWLKDEDGDYINYRNKKVGIKDREEVEEYAEKNFKKALMKLQIYFGYQKKGAEGISEIEKRLGKNKKAKDTVEYIKNATSLNAVMETMLLIQRGIEMYSEAFISEMRLRIQDRMLQPVLEHAKELNRQKGGRFSKKVIEKLKERHKKNLSDKIENQVAPFYKTGAIYVLGELSGHIVNYLTGGQGLVVWNGKAWGRVREVNDKDDVRKFQAGEIFVSMNPTPEVNVAMMAASAIITEKGGSASHAAMIAREHNIPCVVGKFKATSDYETGMFLDIDTEKGKFNIIDKKKYEEIVKERGLCITEETGKTEMKILSFKGLFNTSTLMQKFLKRYMRMPANRGYVVPLDKSSNSDIVGGKAINLYKLRKIGSLNVPDGFTVTVNAYLMTLMKNWGYLCEGLVDIANLSENKIKKIFLKLKIPQEIKEQIKKEYKRIGGGYVSVRSSATTEDTAKSTFAGMHDTYLFDRGLYLVLTHLKKCWASLYSHRAIKHRHSQGIKEQTAMMGVVVQKMVKAKFSGVIYTAISETFKHAWFEKGKRQMVRVPKSKKQMKIEIVKGDGEDLVSGRKTPMLFIATKKDNSYYQVTGRKYRELDNMMPKIIKAALKIENRYGFPQDIEICIKNGELYILQTRNIAVMSEEEKISEEKRLKKVA